MIPAARVVTPAWYRTDMAGIPTAPTAPASAPNPWADPATYLHLLAVILSTLFASGAIPSTGTVETIAVIVASVLGALGYPVVRAVAQSKRAPIAQPEDLRAAFLAGVESHQRAVLASQATLAAAAAATGGAK